MAESTNVNIEATKRRRENPNARRTDQRKRLKREFQLLGPATCLSQNRTMQNL